MTDVTRPRFEMSREDAEEYTQALGQVVAGGWRQVALGERLGVPDALGLATRDWVEQRLGGYVRMSIPDRREAVAELAGEDMTQREIADVLGVHPATVNRDLRVASATDGETESLYQDVGTPPSVADATEPELDEFPPSFDDDPIEQAYQPSPPPPQVNEGDEWYTPRWLFDALGIKFSLDVCAPLDQTHSSVPAERHLTIEDDGLAQPWTGTVWCNPPYSKPEPWARRLIHHRDGLLLTHMPNVISAIDDEVGWLMRPNADGTQGWAVKWESLVARGCHVLVWPIPAQDQLPIEDWPRVATQGGGIEHLRGVGWTG